MSMKEYSLRVRDWNHDRGQAVSWGTPSVPMQQRKVRDV